MVWFLGYGMNIFRSASWLVLGLGFAQMASSAPLNRAGSWKHVIVTSTALRDATADYTWQSLRNHRISRGMTSTIVTVEEISTSYSGRDLQEKIRNFAIDAKANWGTSYLLLGGDVNTIPCRQMYAWSDEVNSVCSDQYFGALNGSWDGDGDNRFGEWDQDTPDGIMDIAVGRVPAETVAEMANYVYKAIKYETSPTNASYLTKGVAWTSNEGGVGQLVDFRQGSYFGPAGIETDHTDNSVFLWQNQPKEVIDRVANSRNYGLNWSGSHGYGGGIAYYDNAWAQGLDNGDAFFVQATLACYAGYMEDNDAFAENLVIANRHGAIGAFFNSNLGYIGTLIDFLIGKYYGDGIPELGNMLLATKNTFLASSRAPYEIWNTYEFNLFGDPALKYRNHFATSLAANYSLDEGTGTTSEDASGNLGNLVINGATWETGKAGLGKALHFDGVNDYAEAPHTWWAPMGRQGEFSVAAWIKPSAYKAYAGIVSKGKTQSTFGLQLMGDGRLRVDVNNGNPEWATGTGSWQSNGTVALNQWHHVAATYEMDSRKLRFYIDGVLDAEHVLGSELFLGDVQEPLVIGCDFFGGDEYFTGSIDEVQVFGYSLSLAEVLLAKQGGRIGVWNPASFAGTGVVQPTASTVDVRHRVSVSAWVNPSATGVPIITRGNLNRAYGFGINTDGTLRFEANAGTLAYAIGGGIWNSSLKVGTGSWHHVATTYDGREVRFWVDGVLDSKKNYADLVFGRNEGDIRIGVSSAGRFAGEMDSVELYGREMTHAEVQRKASGRCSGLRSPWPSVVQAIPGVVQIENFDEGCPEYTYHDADGLNNGGQYRVTGVDIENTPGGGVNVGWVESGEWLEYSINVAQSGQYILGLRASSSNGADSVRFQVDGAAVGSVIAFASTGGLHKYVTKESGLTLSAGAHILRLYIQHSSGGFNLDQLEIRADVPVNMRIASVSSIGMGEMVAIFDIEGDRVAVVPYAGSDSQLGRSALLSPGLYWVKAINSQGMRRLLVQ